MKRLVPVLAVAVLLAACGSRVESDDASGGMGPPPGADQTTTAPGGAAVDGMFGDIESPCGPGDTSSYPEVSDVGVTRDEIVIATIADPGGPRPGLNQGMFDSMDAFAAWCNDQGGINGRTVRVELRDAGIMQYKEQVLWACDNALALVGGLGVLDDLGAQDQVDCGIPNVPGAVVSTQAAGADLTWQILPNLPDKYAIGQAEWVAENFPDAITRAAAIRTQLPVTEVQSNRLMEAYGQAGFEWIFSEGTNINETNWDPLVLAMKNLDVGFFTLTSTYEELLLMMAAMGRQQWEPEVMELEANFYNGSFPRQLAEQGLDPNNVFIRMTVWPFEEADERPAMRQYLDILESHTSRYDTEPELLGVQAFSAGLMFATAANNLGADVTRERLAEELDTITSWTGGGLHGQSNPGERVPSPCFMIIQVTPEGFERVFPLPDADAEIYEAGNGMSCPEGAYADLPDYSGLGARAS